LPFQQIVGDRFVFQSEVLFGGSAADIGRPSSPSWRGPCSDIAQNIPTAINWLLRVDGDTDSRPIITTQIRLSHRA
jgi:chemotaxis protein MotB